MFYVTAMPTWVEKRLKKCFFFIFLWNNKPPRIAYNTLIGEAGKGVMGFIDVEQRKNCLRIKIIKKYLDEGHKTACKKTMLYFLNKCGNLNLGDSILLMKTKNWMVEGLPDFYKELMSAWGKILINVHFNPQGRGSILNQPLFFILNQPILLNNGILSQGKEIFL